MDEEKLDRERAGEIFANIFQEVFLSSNGNPITLE